MTSDNTDNEPKRRLVQTYDSDEFGVLARNLHPHDIIIYNNAFAFLPDRTLLNATQTWSGSVDDLVYVVPLSVTRQYANPFRAYRDCFRSIGDSAELYLDIDLNSSAGRALFRCEPDEVVDALGADRSHSRVKRFLERQPSSLVSLAVTTYEGGGSMGLRIDAGSHMQCFRLPRFSNDFSLDQILDNRSDDIEYEEDVLQSVSTILRSNVSVVVQGPLEWFGTINLLNVAVADIENNLGLGEVTRYVIYAVDNSIAYCVVQTVGGPGFIDTMTLLRKLFGAKQLDVFYDKSINFCPISKRLTYEDKREAKYRQAARHHTIIDIIIAMYSLCLPTYVMLEIVDYLPMMWLQGHRQKIDAIQNCTNSINRVLAQRNKKQNKKQKR